ncbi:MAG: hypothetical protein EHM59_09525, partial [Betaproteobacteria bacterium]
MFGTRTVVALCAFLFAACCNAEWLLKPATERVQPGEILEVTVFVVNDTKAAFGEGLPARLPANARTPTASATLTLEAVDPPPELGAPIASGSFRKQVYRVRIPENLSGTVQIALEHVPTAKLHVAVEAAHREATAVAAAEPALLRVDTVPEPVLSPYEPIYFLVGTRGPNTARFQLSFKYRLFDERGALARMLPGVDKI